jgi:hypothetical protein
MSVTSASELKLTIDGVTVVTSCFEIAAYTDMPFWEAGPGVLEFYRAFLERFSADIQFFYAQNTPRVQAIDDETLDMLPFWFDHKPWRRSHFGLTLYSGQIEREARPPAFEMFGSTVPKHAGYVRLVLPVEILASGVQKILELFQQALGTFPWVSAYAGYSLFWHARHLEHMTTVSRYIGARLLRHPGLNMGEPMFFKKWAKDSVIGAHWITFLSPRFVDELGSLSSVSQNLSTHTLSARVDIEEVPSGVLLRAGGMPEIGDSNRQSVQLFGPYRAVARLLKPIRVRKLRPLTGLSAENTSRWLERFDD